MSSATNSSDTEQTVGNLRKRKLNDIKMSTANKNMSNISYKKKNPLALSLHDSSDLDSDVHSNPDNIELLELFNKQITKIDNGFNKLYNDQIKSVGELLVQVKPSTARKYRMDLRKLIDETKNRAVLALENRETKRENINHTFEVKEQLIKQNFKHYTDVAYGTILTDLENKLTCLNEEHGRQNP